MKIESQFPKCYSVSILLSAMTLAVVSSLLHNTTLLYALPNRNRLRDSWPAGLPLLAIN
jgi:hypothetical protein